MSNWEGGEVDKDRSLEMRFLSKDPSFFDNGVVPKPGLGVTELRPASDRKMRIDLPDVCNDFRREMRYLSRRVTRVVLRYQRVQ